jgi:hypothetical protein
MAGMNPIAEEDVRIVPANEASWDDLQDIFGATDYPARCQCQRFKVVGWIWRDSMQEERTAMLRAQTACGDPKAAASPIPSPGPRSTSPASAAPGRSRPTR